MKEEEILQGNRMIAIFMNKNLLVLPSNTGVGEKRGAPIQYENWFNIKWDRDLKYHNSWDWLMPVWVKCREIINSKIDRKALFCLYDNHYKAITYAILNYEIQIAVDRIIRFITFYNEQNKLSQPPTP